MAEAVASEPYDPDNLLDRHSRRSTLERHYRHMEARERSLVDRRLGLRGGDVLSVGSGWHPGRHLFPGAGLPARRRRPRPGAGLRCARDRPCRRGARGYAGRLELPSQSFDVVLYRLVLHHIAFQGPLSPSFTEAARLLRPGGALIAIEPGAWHPVGAALALANRTGLATRVHGTPDDVPLSPRRLVDEARSAGLSPELHAVTYGWRRLAPRVQGAVTRLDRLGSRPRAAQFPDTP